jgi:hypothetical protein
MASVSTCKDYVMLNVSTYAVPSPSAMAAAFAGCVLGVLRMATWVVLLAVDSELLTNNDTMIQGTASQYQLQLRAKDRRRAGLSAHVNLPRQVAPEWQ